MKDFWNDRYSSEGWAFGQEPNHYFKDKLSKYHPGKILLPGEGEGRNAVYAAQMGWEVTAFDFSDQARIKASKLASQNGVEIDYHVGELGDLNFLHGQFDMIGLIFVHYPAHLKSAYHKALDQLLRPGGAIIFEAFSKSHVRFQAVNPRAGGPKDMDLLFSLVELKRDFGDYHVLELLEEQVTLSEGIHHLGRSSVIRMVGEKKASRVPSLEPFDSG